MSNPNEDRFAMSDHSIATIARSLAAALLDRPEEQRLAEIEAQRKLREEKYIAALQAELCNEYRNELIQTLRF
jgi:hypothetical protein